MYTVLISHHPAHGKNQEALAAIRERSEAANAAGSPHAVVIQMYGKEPNIVNAIRHESLAALEEYGRKNAEDPAFLAATQKIAAALDRAQTPSLQENLVMAQPTSAPNFIRSVTFTAAVGKGPELLKGLQERVTAASGIVGCLGTGLLREVVPEGGTNFTLQILHASLSDMEQFGKANQADKSFQAFQTKLPSLVSGSPAQRLSRVVLPFPM